MKKKRLILLCSMVVGVFLFADDTGRGGYAGSFLRMGLGARPMGMGGGSVALGDDGFTTYYNPAGLTQLQYRIFSSSMRSMALDRRLIYLGYAQSLGKEANEGHGPLRGGFSAGWLMASVDNIDSRDYDGRHLGMLSNGEHCFYFSFALKPNPRLSVGISGKLVYNRFPGMTDAGDAFTSTGFGFDIGLLFTPVESMAIGVTLRDIRAKYTWDSQELYTQGRQIVDRFPRVFRAGVAWHGLSDLRVHADFEQTAILVNSYASDRETLYTPVSTAIGLEWLPVDRFAIRAGLYREAPTFGLGLSTSLLSHVSRLDYAYVSDPVAPGANHIFSWSFLF